jgi:transposase-like protein
MSTMADSKPRPTRRSFTEDFKTGAVRLVLDEGKTINTVGAADVDR